MKPLVYVAGPISSNPMHGAHDACEVGSRLLAIGVLPVLPHLTVLWDMIDPHDYEDWMAYDFGLIDHCQALYRMAGASPGADREVAYAESLGLPVFGIGYRSHTDFIAWATT